MAAPTVSTFVRESAADLETRALAALKQSQTDANAIVSAALNFGKAVESYEQAASEASAEAAGPAPEITVDEGQVAAEAATAEAAASELTATARKTLIDS